MKPLTTILALSILGLSAIVSCKPVDNQEEKRGVITVPATTYCDPVERARIVYYAKTHDIEESSLSKIQY